MPSLAYKHTNKHALMPCTVSLSLPLFHSLTHTHNQKLRFCLAVFNRQRQAATLWSLAQSVVSTVSASAKSTVNGPHAVSAVRRPVEITKPKLLLLRTIIEYNTQTWSASIITPICHHGKSNFGVGFFCSYCEKHVTWTTCAKIRLYYAPMTMNYLCIKLRSKLCMS